MATGFALSQPKPKSPARAAQPRNRRSACRCCNLNWRRRRPHPPPAPDSNPSPSNAKRPSNDSTAERDVLHTEQQTSHDAARTYAARISQLEADLKNERQNLTEKVALLEAAKKTLSDQFAALASDILDQKSKTFSEGSQKEIGTLLNPLRDQIKEFREKVEQAQSESKTGVTKLETLIGTLGNLNEALTEEARNLTTALRGSSKTQGDWGEFILRDLLDKAGLREGEQYTFQQSFAGSKGKAESARASAPTSSSLSARWPQSRHRLEGFAHRLH